MEQRRFAESIGLTTFLILTLPSVLVAQNSVTIAGDLQQSLGYGNNWDPSWATTFLTYDSNSNVCDKVFSLCAGNFRQLTLSYGSNGNQIENDIVSNWRNVAPCGP